MDARSVHVQHRLANVGWKWLAKALPHFIAVTVTFFKQIVVLKAECADTYAFDFDQQVFIIDAHVPVSVT